MGTTIYQIFDYALDLPFASDAEDVADVFVVFVFSVYICLKCKKGDPFESLDEFNKHFEELHSGNEEVRADSSFGEQKVAREGEDTVIAKEKGEEKAATAGPKKEADTEKEKEEADTVIPKEKGEEGAAAGPKKAAKEKGKGKAAAAGSGKAAAAGSKKAGINKRKVRESTLGRYMCFTYIMDWNGMEQHNSRLHAHLKFQCQNCGTRFKRQRWMSKHEAVCNW